MSSSSCYDLCQFPKPPAGDNRCPVDGGVLRDAVRSTRCGHVYGMQCILTYLMRQREACPVCSVPMDAGDLEPAEAVRRRVQALPMSCRELDQCNWVGTVAEEPAHAHGPYCGVYMVQCPFCEVRVREGPAFEAHKETCPEAIVVCEQCYEDMPRKELAMHKKGLGGRICRLTTPMKRQKEATIANVKAKLDAVEKRAREQQAFEKMERMSFHQSMMMTSPAPRTAEPPNHCVGDHPSIIRDDSASPASSRSDEVSGGKKDSNKAKLDQTTRVFPAVPSPGIVNTAHLSAVTGEAESEQGNSKESEETTKDQKKKNEDEEETSSPRTDQVENEDPSVFFEQLPATVDSLQAALFDLTLRHEELEKRHYNLQQTVFDLIDYISSRDMTGGGEAVRSAPSSPSSTTAAGGARFNHSNPSRGVGGTRGEGAPTDECQASRPIYPNMNRSVKPKFMPDMAKKAAFDFVFAGMRDAGAGTAATNSPSGGAQTPQRQLFGQRGSSPQPLRPQHLPPLSSSSAEGTAAKGAMAGKTKDDGPHTKRPQSSPNVMSPQNNKKTAKSTCSHKSNASSGAGAGVVGVKQPKAPSAPPTTVPEGGYRRPSASVASSASSTSTSRASSAERPGAVGVGGEKAMARKSSAVATDTPPTISISEGTPQKRGASGHPQKKTSTPDISSAIGGNSLAPTTNKNRHSSVPASVLAAGVSVSASSSTSSSAVAAAPPMKSPVKYSHIVGGSKALKAASPVNKKVGQ